METKRCARCEQDLPLECFHKKRGKELQAWCKECLRAYKADHYQANKENFQAKARVYRKKIQEQMRDWLFLSVKNVPCMDCGRRFNYWVMDLDHRDPSTKKAELSKFIRNCDWPGLRAEVKKCDVVCANCHRDRTAKQQGWTIRRMI
jgi:hypothetical protein